MDELYQQLPAIIEQAAKSPLGLLALMVIALAGMAFVFFKEASEKARIGIFVLLLAGVAAFAVAAMRVAGPSAKDVEAVPAADVIGAWTATVTYDWPRNGAPAQYEETFVFEPRGHGLGGTASWLERPRSIVEASVEGTSLTFVTRDEVILGDEKREVTRRYFAEITGDDTMHVVLQRSDDPAPLEFDARRAGR